MRKKENNLLAYFKAGAKAALPTLIGLIPVVGPVAEDAVEKVIEAIDKKGEELKKESQEEFKKLMNELNEIRKNGKQTQEMVDRQAEILSEIAKTVGIKEEELCGMIKSETFSGIKKASSYPVFPVYVSGFIVWAEEDKLTKEAQDNLSEIFNNAECDETYEDDDVNEVVQRIKAFIRENIDVANNGCEVSDSFLNFMFDWEKDGYAGYRYNSNAMDAINSFINDLNWLLYNVGWVGTEPFFMSYQVYW